MSAGAAAKPDSETLHKRLLAAHERGDTGALVAIYRQAGEAAEGEGDTDRACFFYVHAYVFALEAGHPDAEWIRERLRRHGREE
jgi:hypothetical protein